MKARFEATQMEVVRNDEVRAVVYGKVIEGTVRDGMYLRIPFDPSFGMVSQIERVETIEVPREDKATVALVLKPAGDPKEDAEFIEQLQISNEILEITETA